MKRRLTVPVLCTCLCLAMLAGCGGSKITSYSGSDSAESSPTSSGGNLVSYDADTVVCTVDESDITWEEYYYFLNTYYTTMESYYGDITDWTAANAYDTSKTNNEEILNLAQPSMLESHVLLAQAEDKGLSVSDDAVNEQIASNIDSAIGDGDGTLSDEEETTFENYLSEDSVSRTLYDTLMKESMTYTALYNDYTANITDEDVLSWADGQGYIAAKQILFPTVDLSSYDSDTSTYTALSDEEIAEAKTNAQDVYAQLQAVADNPDTLATLFDNLMNEYSQDTNLADYPDGYCFLPDNATETYEQTAESLDENYGLSDIVESDEGYVIVLRFPPDPDMTMGYNSSSSTAFSLRDYCMSQEFNGQVDQWYAAAQIVWTDGFENLDLSTVF